MKKRYPIEIVDDCTKTVFFPKDLSISSELQIIAFGNKTVHANFIPHPANKIFISKDIQTELKIPDLKMPLHVFIENDIFLSDHLSVFLQQGLPLSF